MTLTEILLQMGTIWYTPSFDPLYVAHMRHARGGAEVYATELARDLEYAAADEDVPLALLTALAYDESGLNRGAVSVVGAYGPLQVHPASRWGEEARRACRKLSRRACLAAIVRAGARAIRDALSACPTETSAVGWYRSGHCLVGPRGRHTVQLARDIAPHLTPATQCGGDS